MGGRGSGFGGGGGGLSSILGRKGAPRTIDEAKARSNPHFSEGEEWKNNCQRCVWAYEMQRRGYNVEAKQYLGDTDPLPFAHGPDGKGGGWMDVAENLEARKVYELKASLPKRFYSMSEEKITPAIVDTINRHMAIEGDGARSIISVQWKNNNCGHVFIAEQEKGVTRYLDPQTGRNVIPERYIEDANPARIQVIRVDNAKINKDMIDKCVQRRK